MRRRYTSLQNSRKRKRTYRQGHIEQFRIVICEGRIIIDSNWRHIRWSVHCGRKRRRVLAGRLIWKRDSWTNRQTRTVSQANFTGPVDPVRLCTALGIFPDSVMSVDRRQAAVFAGAFALRLLLLVLFPSLPDLLTGRVEVSTPVTSFKRRE